jgi:WD40 repeat protein
MKTQTIFSIVFAFITLVFTSCEDAVMEGEKGDFVYLQTLEGHTDGVNSASYSPDRTKIVSASGDNTIKIWEREVVVTYN